MPPFPNEDSWIVFGFCICRNEQETLSLAAMYHALIQKCTFKDFWEAVHFSTLNKLFDKYRLRLVDGRQAHLEAILSNIQALPSVWYLKAFVASKEASPDLPSSLQAVAVDYGFINCRSPLQRTALKAMYSKLLQDRRVDELKLHAACLQNRVSEFCSFFLQQDDMTHLSPLMENPYPLDPPLALAGLVAKDVICCKESDRETVMAALKDEDKRKVLLTHPDEITASYEDAIASWNDHVLGLEGDRLDESVEIPMDRLHPDHRKKVQMVQQIDSKGQKIMNLLLLPALSQTK